VTAALSNRAICPLVKTLSYEGNVGRFRDSAIQDFDYREKEQAMSIRGRQMPWRRREIIFEATIEYEYDHSTQRKLLLESSDDQYRQIQEVVTQTLTTDLPKDLQIAFGMRVEINIKAVQSGSLIVIFGAILSTYEILSSFKDFSDSIQLIREEANKLIRVAVRKFGSFDTNVLVRYPKIKDDHDMMRRMRMDIEFQNAWRELYRSRYDGFFYFLLVLCVIQFLIIALLVYGAVIRTYF
jgi:hypothetical protein